MNVQKDPASFSGTLLDVNKTHVTVVLDLNKSSQLETFIKGELVLMGSIHCMHVVLRCVMLYCIASPYRDIAVPCLALPCPASPHLALLALLYLTTHHISSLYM